MTYLGMDYLNLSEGRDPFHELLARVTEDRLDLFDKMLIQSVLLADPQIRRGMVADRLIALGAGTSESSVGAFSVAALACEEAEVVRAALAKVAGDRERKRAKLASKGAGRRVRVSAKLAKVEAKRKREKLAKEKPNFKGISATSIRRAWYKYFRGCRSASSAVETHALDTREADGIVSREVDRVAD